MQFLKVGLGLPERGYTYAWNSPAPIQRGDHVVVPPNSYNPYPAIGRVLRVMETPDFTGTCTVLRHKAEVEIEQVQVQQGQPYRVAEYVPTEDDVYWDEHQKPDDVL